MPSRPAGRGEGTATFAALRRYSAGQCGVDACQGRPAHGERTAQRSSGTEAQRHSGSAMPPARYRRTRGTSGSLEGCGSHSSLHPPLQANPSAAPDGASKFGAVSRRPITFQLNQWPAAVARYEIRHTLREACRHKIQNKNIPGEVALGEFSIVHIGEFGDDSRWISNKRWDSAGGFGFSSPDFQLTLRMIKPATAAESSACSRLVSGITVPT